MTNVKTSGDTRTLFVVYLVGGGVRREVSVIPDNASVREWYMNRMTLNGYHWEFIEVPFHDGPVVDLNVDIGEMKT